MKLNHADETKTTYVCPGCDQPYFQVDREEWEQNVEKYDKQAYRFRKFKHTCWWKKGKGRTK